MKLFVVDPHTIYRRGLAACLEALPEVQSVGQAGSARQAWEDDALFASELVLVDHAMTGGLEFVAAVREATGAAVVVCSSLCSEDAVLPRCRPAPSGSCARRRSAPSRWGAPCARRPTAPGS